MPPHENRFAVQEQSDDCDTQTRNNEYSNDHFTYRAASKRISYFGITLESISNTTPAMMLALLA
jgi:hypothetical protein